MITANHPASPMVLTEIEFQKLKQNVHETLVQSLDLASVSEVDNEQVRGEIAALADRYVDDVPSLDTLHRERLREELTDELYGLGPLEPLLRDGEVSDILVNSPHEVFVERHGKLSRTQVVFADESHLLRIIQRVVSRVGRRIDEVSPVVDARLPDGSRVNAIIPPLAMGGAKLSIRRFLAGFLQLESLVANETLSMDMAQFLAAAVEARLNIVFSGGTGAGKTTMLDALSAAIPTDERVVTIEDSAELVLQHPHVVRLETRPSNQEGFGEYSQRDLVRNSLRMRPDRIIVGEVRGGEALDMLQAMNTGHEGSLSTIHANDTHDALARMELMVMMTGFDLPIPVIRQYIASGVNLVVHLARLKGGVRRVMRITEIAGFEDGTYQLEDVFQSRLTGVDGEGKAKTRFVSTGYQAKCLERFSEFGVRLGESPLLRQTLVKRKS